MPGLRIHALRLHTASLRLSNFCILTCVMHLYCLTSTIKSIILCLWFKGQIDSLQYTEKEYSRIQRIL